MPTSDPRTLLVHICCSVDSHHFLSELRALLPKTKLIGYFYNPNIHPEEEYQLRLMDVRRSSRLLGIPLLEEFYDPKDWLRESIGMEHYPEKGERCSFCFDFRLNRSAQKALELGCDSFTTTLLASPMKSIPQLFSQGKELEQIWGIRFYPLDTRSHGGSARQQQLAKASHLYRQNYCGCLYALKAQREQLQKRPLELLSPLSPQRAKEGIFAQRRHALERRDFFEKSGQPYFFGKEKRIFWQNLFTRFQDSKGASIPCHALAPSLLSRPLSLRVELHHKGMAYFDKEGIRAIDLELWRRLTLQKQSSIQELIYHPLSIKEELRLREELGDSPLSTSPLLILKELPPLGESCKLTLHSLWQEESIEKVWKL